MRAEHESKYIIRTSGLTYVPVGIPVLLQLVICKVKLSHINVIKHFQTFMWRIVANLCIFLIFFVVHVLSVHTVR